MYSPLQKALAISALSALCLSPSGLFAADNGPAKSKKKPAAAATAVSAEDVRQLKEMLQQQQQQINEMRQQMTQRDQQLQQTKQQLSDAQRTAVEAQQHAQAAEAAVNESKPSAEAIKTVQDDVNSVKNTLAETINTTLEEQKKTSALASTLGRFRWSGDVRVRFEDFFRDNTQDRYRTRVRARFGFESSLSDDFVAGAFLATGSLNDPTSTNETFTNFFERKTIGLDRAYVTYAPKAHKWLALTGGKFAPTWQKTNQVFDPDLNPEGFSEKLSFNVNNPFLKNVSFIGLQLDVNEASSSNDAFVYGGQAQAKLQLGKFWTMTPSYTILNFRNENQLLSIGSTSTAITGTYTSGTSTYGYFAPNGLTNCVRAATTAAPNAARTFCSKFLVSEIILNNQIKTGLPKLPFNLLAEYGQNLNAEPSTVDGRKHDKLYFMEASLGQSKAKGDAQFGYSFARTEQDAVLASFAESDQRFPTNVAQHRIFGNYRVRNNVTLGYTQWIGRTLNSRLFGSTNSGASTSPFAAGTTEHLLKRGQLDVVFTF